jgi:predicted Zn-dependent protease
MILEQLALYYVEHHQEKKSLPLFKKLLDQNPENHKVLRHMADIYLTLEDSETSEVLVKRALSLSPKTPKYAITLVEIYYNTKRKDEAITLMEDIVKRRPANL